MVVGKQSGPIALWRRTPTRHLHKAEAALYWEFVSDTDQPHFHLNKQIIE